MVKLVGEIGRCCLGGSAFRPTRRPEGRPAGIVRWLCTLLLAGAGLIPNAWSAVTLRAEPAELVLGELLTLTLESRDSPLEDIDLAPLKADFEVHARTLGRSGGQETLSLTLYPLRTGRLALPALAAGPSRTRPLAIRVLESSEAMPKVTMRVETDPPTPHVRQPTRLTLEICDDGSLEWKPPVLPTHAALHHRPLGEQQLDVERGGQRCTAHLYHWSVLATRAGEIALPLPMLEAVKFGRRLRLPAPPVSIPAAPVPAWLPLNVPVGRPAMQMAPLPATWPLDRPLAWRLTVTGGYSADGLKALLALQTQPHPALNVYPPASDALPAEDGRSPLTRLSATLYLLPSERGHLDLPELGLPYFDPASGRLERLSLTGPRVAVFDPLLEKLKWATAGLGGLALLMAAAYGLHRTLRWRLARRRGLADLAQATDIADLARRMRAFSLRPGQSAAQTLEIWQASMQSENRCEGLADLVASLEQARYGQRPLSLDALKARALGVLRRVRPA